VLPAILEPMALARPTPIREINEKMRRYSIVACPISFFIFINMILTGN
jgi:hypothetical protein